MKLTHAPRLIVATAAIGLVAAGVATTAQGSGEESGQKDLASVRREVVQFNSIEEAMDGGWGLVPGLDHCFEREDGQAAMGVHYIKGVDTELDPLEPEALVFHQLPNGKTKLGAVEYIVPIKAWEDEGHEHPPMVLGEHLHANTGLGVYVLHAWLFTQNPDGIFEDWNTRVSCPS